MIPAARIAGHTYAFRHLPLEAALDELGRLGFSWVEVWLGHVPGTDAAAAQALAERGMRAAAVSAGGFYDQGGASPERAFALVHALGAPVLVACVAPSRLAEIAALVPPGVTLCLENHWDQALATSEEVAEALGGLDRAAACLDTGHALLAGVEPDRFARSLGSRLGHVHLKDARRLRAVERLAGRRVRRRFLPRPQPVFPGQGALDLEGLASALAAIGYRGTVTLEHEGPEPAAALARLLEGWQRLAPPP